MTTKADHNRKMMADEPHSSHVSALSGLVIQPKHLTTYRDHIEEYIKKERPEKWQPHTIIKDLIYFLGIAIDKKRFFAGNGFDKFKPLFLELLDAGSTNNGWIKVSDKTPEPTCDINDLHLWCPDNGHGQQLMLGQYDGKTFTADFETDDDFNSIRREELYVTHWKLAPHLGPDHVDSIIILRSAV